MLLTRIVIMKSKKKFQTNIEISILEAKWPQESGTSKNGNMKADKHTTMGNLNTAITNVGNIYQAIDRISVLGK